MRKFQITTTIHVVPLVTLLVLFFFALQLHGQNPVTPTMPSTAPTDAELGVQGNRVSTLLASSVNNSTTTFTVTDASRLLIGMLLRVQNEVVRVDNIVSNTLTVTRGYDGTTAASHSAYATVENDNDTARYHNAVAAEIKAISSYLVANPFAGFVPSTRAINGTAGRIQGGGDLTADRTLDLVTTAVTPGAYTCVDATFDAYGRATAAANGTCGTGDVVGPASATDNAIARYDLTTGKLLQASLITIDDVGNTYLPNATTIFGRNAANTQNLPMMVMSGADSAIIGSASGVQYTTLIGSVGVSASVGSINRLLLTADGLSINNAGIGSGTGVGLYLGSGSTSISDLILRPMTTPGSPTNGQMWYDTSLGKFRCREGGTTVNCIGASAGSGDVVGPASAVDSNLAAFDTTTGKLLKDSGKAPPSGAIVGTTDTQTLTAKTLTGPILAVTVVGSLPSAAASTGMVYPVTDSTSIGDCTTGGGSAITLCRSNGSAWAAFGDGNSGGPGSVSVQVGGSAVATESTIDFQPGTGIQISGTNPTGKAQVTIGNDTSVMQTKAAAQAGAELVCAPASGTNTLTCAMTPTLSSYATGMTLKLVPFANNTTAVTLDIDTIGAVAVETSGSTALSANDLVAGEAVLLTYNGTEFRFIGPAPSETGSPTVTASRAVVSDGSGNLTAATTTSTEIGYVNGVTSAIQTQLNGKLPTTTPFDKAITVESPTSSEDISLWRTPYAITVTRLYCVNVGTTPSVTYTIRHGSDRSAAGNEVVTGGSTTTSTTTGDSVTSFNDATIPANSFIWFETTAQSGTVTSTNCTIEFTRD